MAFKIREFGMRIRRRETPFYEFLYCLAKRMRSFSMPCLPLFHSFLYHERDVRLNVWHNFWRVVYYEPIFKSQCSAVGKHFRMEYAGNGTTRIHGNLKINFGKNVTIFDNTQFVGLKVFDNPQLTVGDYTYLGPRVRFLVGKKVSVGSHCLITSSMITDNPGHPVDEVLTRMKMSGGSPLEQTIKSVTIGDFCFLPLETIVYPGVSVGDGVVARVGTHISEDVPPFCQIAGNPMRIVRKLPIPEELAGIVGQDRYLSYLKAHENLLVGAG